MSASFTVTLLALIFGLPALVIWGLSHWFLKGLNTAMQPAADSEP